MRNILWSIVCVFALSTICSAQSIYYLPQVADGTQSDGTVWYEFIGVTNTAANGTAAANGTIVFTQDDGTPFNIKFTDENNQPVGSGNTISFQIAGGQTRYYGSTAEGPLKTGFATINSNLAVAAGGIFVEYGNNGTTLIAEAGVPSAQPLTRQTINVIKTKRLPMPITLQPTLRFNFWTRMASWLFQPSPGL